MSTYKQPQKLTRRALLGGLLGSAASAALADAPTRSVRPPARDTALARHAISPVERLVDASRLTGKVAFMLMDAETGEVLEARSPLLQLPPASTAKTITALYALDALGAEYRFDTRLVATGTISEGRIDGDLWLVGGGDPSLDTDALADMARRLKEEAGIFAITGSFRICASMLPTIPEIDPGQPVHVGYNPAVSGINLNYNRVHFEWKQQQDGYSVSMDAPAQKFSPAVSVSRMQVVDRNGPVYTYLSGDEADEWTVARTALGKEGSRWLPIRKPEAYVADVFRSLARSYGIDLPEAEITADVPDGNVLVSRESAPLTDVLHDMLKWSTNLTAEVVGLAATVARGTKPVTLHDSAAAMDAWAEQALGAPRVEFVDHSGLGEASRISARDMVRALRMGRELGRLPGLLKEIPVKDDGGRPMEKGSVKVHAKTGTLNFVSALAGYITTPERELIFAYLSADMDARANADMEEERPEGSQVWKNRSRNLQNELIRRWADNFGKLDPVVDAG